MAKPPRMPVVRSARGPKQLLPWIFSGLLLVAALGLVIVKMREQRRVYEAPRTQPILSPPEQDRLARLFEDAKNRIREGKFTEAKVRLLELQGAAPEYPSLQDFLVRVEKEIPNQRHLEAAQEALAQQKLAVARAELDQLRPDTLMFEQAQELSEQLRRLDEEAASAPPPPSSKELGKTAARRFLDGELSQATMIAQVCASTEPGCRRLVRNLRRFTSLYERLEKLNAQELSALIDSESTILGPKTPSKVFQTVSLSVANRFYQGALAAKAQGQWVRAIEFAQHVLLAQPGHDGATRVIAELRLKAKELFLFVSPPPDANPEDIIRRYHEAMALTLPDDEMHQKAKRWIEQLER